METTLTLGSTSRGTERCKCRERESLTVFTQCGVCIIWGCTAPHCTTIMHLSYHSKGDACIHLTNRDTDTFGRSALHENYQYTK